MKVLDQYVSPHASVYHADCVEGVAGLPACSVDFIVFSPPFSGRGRDLFVYSCDQRDAGNSKGDGVFEEHMGFLAPSLFRALKPGRMMAVHCMDIQLSLTHHGVIGFFDFPGQLVRTYEAAGFIYYGRITIWKDPVVAEQRTHARNLGHGLMCQDSAMASIGLPDYILLMRKPGVNEEPIAHVPPDPLAVKDDAGKPRHWQQWASPAWAMPGDDQSHIMRALYAAIVRGDAERASDLARVAAAMKHVDEEWGMPLHSMVWATANGVYAGDGFVDYESPRAGNPDARGIDQGDTLNFRAAREHDDERHICPLQVGVVKRLLSLYTNPRDIVLTPFMGIGTEVAVAVEMGRRGVGFELKGSYYRQAVEHVKRVEPGASGQQIALAGVT